MLKEEETGELVNLGVVTTSPSESKFISCGCIVFPKTSFGSSTVATGLRLGFFFCIMGDTKSSSLSSSGAK